MKTWVKWVLIAFVLLVLALIDFLFNISNYITIGLAVLFLVGLPIYRILRHKEVFMSMLRNMEGNIYGKPLDKMFWKKGELQNIKLKVRWRKNKKNGKKKKKKLV